MAVMEKSRTEERIDELSAKVDWGFEVVEKRFEQVDRRFEEVDRKLDKIDDRFDKVDARFERIDDRFGEVNAEFVAVRKEMKEGFEKLNRTMIWFAGILIAAFIVQGFALMIQAFAS